LHIWRKNRVWGNKSSRYSWYYFQLFKTYTILCLLFTKDIDYLKYNPMSLNYNVTYWSKLLSTVELRNKPRIKDKLGKCNHTKLG
jgi:hypothetical protein